uniref:Hypothetical secreted protein 1488 n=1 Tax=Amblyomma variegatum TaxID=34610 RepID=F0J9W2_AMBVA|nr:TPA_inf: hypothetical secreted protein 1488 [Amblyomma variegatum]
MQRGSRRRMWYRAWRWSVLVCCLLVLGALPGPCSCDKAGGDNAGVAGKRHSDDSASSGEETEGLQAPASEVHLPRLSKTSAVRSSDDMPSDPEARGAPDARSNNRV